MRKPPHVALVVGLFLIGGAANRAQDDPRRGRDATPPPGPAHGLDSINAKVNLARPEPPVDEDANGHVHLKEHKDRSAIHVHVKRLTPGAVYTVRFQKGDVSEDAGQITIPVREPKPARAGCFSASLDGAQEVPPVETEATGGAKLRLEGRDRNVLHYEVKTQGLSGPVTGAHIHAAAVGVDGDVLIPLDHETLRGKVEVTAEQIAALESGDTYVNVHTEANPDGEIRGQIGACPPPPPPPPSGNGSLKIDTRRGDELPVDAASISDLIGATVSVVDAGAAVVLSAVIESLEKPKPPPPAPRCFSAALDTAQEVPPPVGASGTGTAAFHLEKRDRSVLRYEVKVEGLIGPATAAHIHAAAPGVPGDVLIPLDHTTLEGKVEVTPEQVAAIESGNTYVNVHTEANASGEIRGQISICSPMPPSGRDSEEDGAGGSALVGSDFFFEEFDFDIEVFHDASFRRGDVNEDGTLDIADPVRGLAILFLGAPRPYCRDAADSNDDGQFDITDPIASLLSLFGGEGPLPAPGVDGWAGFDRSADDLVCEETF
jgi:hypothetical protein